MASQASRGHALDYKGHNGSHPQVYCGRAGHNKYSSPRRALKKDFLLNVHVASLDAAAIKIFWLLHYILPN